jgi:hypothetical protein
MDKKELRALSKKQLLRLVAEQNEFFIKQIKLLQEENTLLRKRLEEVEGLLKSFDNSHTPSSKKRKKNTNKENKGPRFPGKPKDSNGGGIKLPPPDDVVKHTLNTCPVSGLPLGKPIGYRTKTIIDFPEKPIQVIEHRIFQYISPATGEIIEANVNLSNDIYGPRLKSIVTMLKNDHMSHQKISKLMRELGAPTFSSATVQNIAAFFSEKLKRVRNAFLGIIRKSPYAHGDETGMRKDGKNGYIWGIFTATIAIFHAATSRARKNIIKLLKDYLGVVICDGYNAYEFFKFIQRCWAHLIRDVKYVAKKDKEVKVQYSRLMILYEQLKKMNQGPPNEKKIKKAKWTLGDIANCLSKIKAGKKLATLIQNGGDAWFTALYHEGVPLDNNPAERGLRHVVLLRKIAGCYRNEKGKAWIDVCLSVLYTWRLQGKNIFKQLCAVQQRH